jgi:hypothetical protein
MELPQFVSDLLSLLLDDDERVESLLLWDQVDQIVALTYEYTGSGVFICFELARTATPLPGADHLRLGGVTIESGEIDIGAQVDIIIKKGLIDYLEVWCPGDSYPSQNLSHYTLKQGWQGSPGRVIAR